MGIIRGSGTFNPEWLCDEVGSKKKKQDTGKAKNGKDGESILYL